MRRLATFALCGSLVLLITYESLAAAPAQRSKPAKSAPRGAPANAPRPLEYRLAEPTSEVKLRIKRIRSGARIMLYTGYTLSGFGLVSTITGVVLIGIAQGNTLQSAGIAALITGAVTLAGGSAIWAAGRARMNKADRLLIKAQLRQVQLHDPTRRRPETHALALPKTHTIFSAQLRF